MGDGISDIAKRGLPFGDNSPRMDGNCDGCGEPLPEKGVAWAGVEGSRWKWHLSCAPANLFAAKEEGK